MSQRHENDDEFQWTGRDYFEVDLPTLLAMPVQGAHAHKPPAKPAAPVPAPPMPDPVPVTVPVEALLAPTAELTIEELEDPDSTRLFTPPPRPVPTSPDGEKR